jgi:nucleotide-binding universal stress UspA family protein
MRRVLVPLDGTPQAARALADARHLMGEGGELILVRDTGPLLQAERAASADEREATGEPDQYLHSVATTVRNGGVTVRVLEGAEFLSHPLGSTKLELNFDLIACATHDSDSRRKLAWHNTLHQALTHSPVPILVCRPDSSTVRSETAKPRLMVPLDGSEFAEAALPLAEALAKEWNVPIRLTQVVSVQAEPYTEEVARSTEYLQRVGSQLDCPVRIDLVTGRSTSTMLIRTVKDWSITDVVLASHGRTSSPRAVVGSVAAALIQHLRCRIVVVPPLDAESLAPLRRFGHGQQSNEPHAISL